MGSTQGVEKTLELRVTSGACWESSETQEWSGTLSNLKERFRNSPTTGYTIDGHDYVPSEFYQRLGQYLLENLHQEDLRRVTGTLATENSWQRSTGRPPLTERDRLYHTYLALESEEMKNAPKGQRSSVFQDSGEGADMFEAEQIRQNAYWTIASRFMLNRGDIMYGKLFDGLKEEVMRIWTEEACEKSIFPYLDSLATKQ